jgi:hypothetical protein
MPGWQTYLGHGAPGCRASRVMSCEDPAHESWTTFDAASVIFGVGECAQRVTTEPDPATTTTGSRRR